MAELSKQKRVLFLCTGNSCRSQFAEAIVNHFLTDHWIAFSAGTDPAGYVHPFTIKALAEIGINHQGRSKSVDEFFNEPFDLVMTVCDQAAENCPVWLGMGQKVHISFTDPVKTIGSEEEVLNAFRLVCEDIRIKVIDYLVHFTEKQNTNR